LSLKQSEKKFLEFSPLKKLKFQSNKDRETQSSQEDSSVIKVINFVAIKSKKTEPDYKPRNKIFLQKPKLNK